MLQKVADPGSDPSPAENFFSLNYTYLSFEPRGKESTEVRKSQIKGKESENSYQELKRSQKGHAHTETESRRPYQS